MIAGRGTPDQGPAHAMKAAEPAAFDALMERLTEATIDYLSAQVEAGAEVVKIFDSWAGSLKGADFDRYALEPAKRIIAALKARHPGLPVIAFPRQAGEKYVGFARATGADCVALDNSVDADWAARARAGRWLRAGEPRAAPPGRGRPGAGERDEADRAGLLRRAAYLQPRPRHHARGRPRERPPDAGGDPRVRPRIAAEAPAAQLEHRGQLSEIKGNPKKS
jgi:hypothetical protein